MSSNNDNNNNTEANNIQTTTNAKKEYVYVSGKNSFLKDNQYYYYHRENNEYVPISFLSSAPNLKPIKGVLHVREESPIFTSNVTVSDTLATLDKDIFKYNYEDYKKHHKKSSDIVSFLIIHPDDRPIPKPKSKKNKNKVVNPLTGKTITIENKQSKKTQTFKDLLKIYNFNANTKIFSLIPPDEINYYYINSSKDDRDNGKFFKKRTANGKLIKKFQSLTHDNVLINGTVLLKTNNEAPRTIPDLRYKERVIHTNFPIAINTSNSELIKNIILPKIEEDFYPNAATTFIFSFTLLEEDKKGRLFSVEQNIDTLIYNNNREQFIANLINALNRVQNKHAGSEFVSFILDQIKITSFVNELVGGCNLDNTGFFEKKQSDYFIKYDDNSYLKYIKFIPNNNCLLIIFMNHEYKYNNTCYHSRFDEPKKSYSFEHDKIPLMIKLRQTLDLAPFDELIPISSIQKLADEYNTNVTLITPNGSPREYVSTNQLITKTLKIILLNNHYFEYIDSDHHLFNTAKTTYITTYQQLYDKYLSLSTNPSDHIISPKKSLITKHDITVTNFIEPPKDTFKNSILNLKRITIHTTPDTYITNTKDITENTLNDNIKTTNETKINFKHNNHDKKSNITKINLHDSNKKDTKKEVTIINNIQNIDENVHTIINFSNESNDSKPINVNISKFNNPSQPIRSRYFNDEIRANNTNTLFLKVHFNNSDINKPSSIFVRYDSFYDEFDGDDMFDKLLNCLSLNPEINFLITHGGSTLDLKPFYNAIINSKLIDTNIQKPYYSIINDVYYDMRFNNIHKTIDMKLFFKYEFDELCQKMNIKTDLTNPFNYMIAMQDTFFSLENTLFSLSNVSMINHSTINSFAEYSWKKILQQKYPSIIFHKLSKSQYDITIAAKYGAYMFCLKHFFKSRGENDFLRKIDCSSLYAFIMYFYYFPIGPAHTLTADEILDLNNNLGKLIEKYSILHIYYQAPKNIRVAILPKHDKESLVWNLEDSSGTFTSHLINLAIKKGYKITKIVSGISWNETSNLIFRDFVKPIYVCKELSRDTNQVLNKAAKQLLVGLYGRSFPNQGDIKSETCTTHKEVSNTCSKSLPISMIPNFVKKTLLVSTRDANSNLNKAYYLGVFILDYSRIYMNEIIDFLDIEDTPFYGIFTDSIYITQKQYEKLENSNYFYKTMPDNLTETEQHDFLINNNLGKFRDDLDGKIYEAYFYRPNICRFKYIDNDNKDSFKCKYPGVRNCMIKYEDFDRKDNSYTYLTKTFKTVYKSVSPDLWTGMDLINGQWYPKGYTF